MAGTPSRGARATDRPLVGIVYFCAALLLFVFMNSQVKYLTETYPVPMIIWARYFFHCLLVFLFFIRRAPTLLGGPHRDIQLLRSVLVFLATGCTYFGLSFLPLADAIALSFLSPLFVTVLSVIVLKETVGIRRWIAVAIGFFGMLVIVRPGLTVFQPAAFFMVAMALFLASYSVATRLISHVADPVTSLFYQALTGAVIASVAVPFFWKFPVDWQDALMMVAIGFFGGFGHLMMIRGFQRAEASTLAPFAYTELIWGLLFGLALFGDFPDLWTLVGAAIIVASGLYVANRERRRQRAPHAPDTPA